MKGTLSLRAIPPRSLRAHFARTAILMALVLAQTACLLSALMLERAMRQELSLAEARLGADILVYPSAAMSKISAETLLMQGTPVEVWKDRDTLKRLSDCDGIGEISYQLYIRDRTAEAPVWIVGFEPDTDFAIAPWIPGGRIAPGRREVLVGCEVSVDSDRAVTLFGRAWPVAAVLERTDSELDRTVFADMATLSDLIEVSGEAKYRKIDPENDFTAALIRVRDRANVDGVTHWINAYVRKTKAVRSEATLTDAAAGIRGQIRAIAIVAACAWLVLLLAQAVVQRLMLRERRRELYVWRAVGASRSVVARMMLSEAAIIAVLGGLAGVLIAAAGTYLAVGARFSLPAACACGLIAIGLSVIIGCAGACAAVKRELGRPDGQMLLTV